ncbi:MAG: hypothetical protein OER86_12000, partial [Phycisphaerae bacterium]|nr:hypothetical protein [Phycisphaerae bacterium]
GAARPAHRAAPVAGAHEANLPAGARGEPGNRHRLTVPGRLAAERVITRRTAHTPSNPALVKVQIGDINTYENLLRPIGLRSDGEVNLDPGHSLFRLRSLAGVTTSELAAASVERQRIRNSAPRGNRAQIVRLGRLGGKAAKRNPAGVRPAGRDAGNPNIIGPQRRHQTPTVPKAPPAPAGAIARAY